MGEYMCLKNILKKLGDNVPVQILFLLFVLLSFISPAFAGFNDCATSWNNFTGANGFIADYTYKGQSIKDLNRLVPVIPPMVRQMFRLRRLTLPPGQLPHKSRWIDYSIVWIL